MRLYSLVFFILFSGIACTDKSTSSTLDVDMMSHEDSHDLGVEMDIDSDVDEGSDTEGDEN